LSLLYHSYFVLLKIICKQIFIGLIVLSYCS